MVINGLGGSLAGCGEGGNRPSGRLESGKETNEKQGFTSLNSS